MVDELNVLKRKHIPYETYFGEMELDDEEKEKRIELAQKLEPIFLFLFAVIAEDEIEYCYEMVARRYADVVSEVMKDEIAEYGYTYQYIQSVAKEIVDTTVKNIKSDYYKSEDRAKFIAENESNSVANYYQQIKAIADGKQYKTWISMKDRHVRHTHADVDEEKIGIYEAFTVGDSKMLYPKDRSLGADPEEIINCRCSVIYS